MDDAGNTPGVESVGTVQSPHPAAVRRMVRSGRPPTPSVSKPLLGKTTGPAQAGRAKQSSPKRARQPSKAEKSMAKTSPKKSGGVNKSDEIRKVAAAMKAKGDKPRPSVIVAELNTKGVKVAPAQVSMVLKKMGFRPLRRRKKAGGVPVVGGAAPKSAGRQQAVSVDDLIAAKKMAGSLGGTEKAIAALQALKRFEG